MADVADVSTMSEAQLLRCRKYFYNFDEDNDGALSWTEFRTMNKTIGLQISESKMNKRFLRADNDKNGIITFAEFLTSFYPGNNEQTSTDSKSVESIYALSDTQLDEVRKYCYGKNSTSGKMTRIEFVQMMSELGIGMINDELDSIFGIADINKDGMVSFEEFADLIKEGAPCTQKPPERDALMTTWHQHFKKLDTDGDEKLNKTEFQFFLKEIGKELGRWKLGKMFRQVDKTRDGLVSWEEFKDVYSAQGESKPGKKLTAPKSSLPKQKKLTKQEIVHCCKYFWSADADGDGRLSKSEFGNMMKSLGINMTTEEVDQAFDVADKDKKGSISFNEFAQRYLKRENKHTLSAEEIKQTFSKVDKHKKGYLTMDECLKALKLLGNDMDSNLIQGVINMMDGNHDGQISLSEFCVFLDIGE